MKLQYWQSPGKTKENHVRCSQDTRLFGGDSNLVPSVTSLERYCYINLLDVSSVSAINVTVNNGWFLVPYISWASPLAGRFRSISRRLSLDGLATWWLIYKYNILKVSCSVLTAVANVKKNQKISLISRSHVKLGLQPTAQNENYKRTMCKIKMAVFWIFAPCSWCTFADLTMEAPSTSVTSVNSYELTRRKTPKDSHLHNGRRENLKSHDLQHNCLSTVTFEHETFKPERQ
jgi:hypothetical protein